MTSFPAVKVAERGGDVEITNPAEAVQAANLELLLEEVDSAAAAFASLGQFSAEVRSEIRRSFLPDRISDTLNMEGVRVNPRITRAILDGLTVAEADRYTEQEVLNIIGADELIVEDAAAGRPLTVQLIKEVHRRVEDQLIDSAGSFRQQEVGITGAPQQPPSWPDVPDLVRSMCEAFEAARDVHPVVRAAWVHATFTAIHPFMDGNGRTGRLLQDFSLLSGGLLPVGIPIPRRGDYYEALELADSGVWRNLIEIVAESELAALDKAKRIAEAPVQRRSKVKKLLEAAQATVRQTEYNQYEVWRRRAEGIRDEFARWADDISSDGGETLSVRARTYDPISFEKWSEIRSHGKATGTWLLSLSFAVSRRPIYTFLLFARRHEYSYVHDSQPVDSGQVGIFLTGADEPDTRFTFGRFDDPYVALRELLYLDGELVVYRDPTVRVEGSLPDGVQANIDAEKWRSTNSPLADTVENFYTDALAKLGLIQR